ncbi:CoA transferase [Methylobacterium sp. J-088]|uniref:CaiB/BaiF CoA transferase family protein n=1 Tax=Methylobacterium sp. J-088 TaxID=2836664 RepID=UPI001FB96CAB|nr:CoA transferase [Methylobacterium sp. J-088]MCJ2065843.1 CoA transferase [Methylobacterium sp. J-088]
MPSAHALSRFTVLDLTRVRSGPTAVRQLADWGADVIKIEPPGGDRIGGNRDGSDFQNLHRNKRSLTLDLKQPEGVAVLKRLAHSADVLVENFRPDVKERLGIGYAALAAENPRLVYASISGYGQNGPYRMRPGLDQIAQGMGGLMSITGEAGGGPVRAGIAVADSSAGLYCALGILTALLEREQSGQGQWVQTSLLQAQIALLDFQAARWTMDHEVPPQIGNHHPTASPMGAFPAADGHVNIAPIGEAMWRRLCAVLGHPEWAEDPRFADQPARSRNRHDLAEAITAVTRTRTAAHWVEALNAAEIACGPVYTMDQVFSDPQVQHLGMAETVEHQRLGPIGLIAQPIRMSRSEGHVRTAAPDLGAQSDTILHAFGFDAQAVADLREKRVI